MNAKTRKQLAHAIAAAQIDSFLTRCCHIYERDGDFTFSGLDSKESEKLIGALCELMEYHQLRADIGLVRTNTSIVYDATLKEPPCPATA